MRGVEPVSSMRQRVCRCEPGVSTHPEPKLPPCKFFARWIYRGPCFFFLSHAPPSACTGSRLPVLQWRADRLRVQIFSAGSRQGDLKSNFRFQEISYRSGNFWRKLDFKSPCLLPAEKIWTLNLSARHCNENGRKANPPKTKEH